MKRSMVAILLCLLLVCTVATAFAAEVKPGDTITMKISITAAEGSAARISINTNGAPVSFVSSTADNHDGNTVAKMNSLSGRFSIMNLDGIATGSVGTVTLKVNDNASPGTYTVSPVGSLGATGVSGSVTFTIPAAECSHTWDNGSVTTPAACETSGVKTFTCTQCGETKEETIPPTGHTVVDGETVQPTCTQDGYTTGVCSVCGKELEKQVLPALDHLSDGGKETKAPTCTEAGVKTHTCTRCGEVIKTEEIPALDHLSDGGKVTKVPTCTEKGVNTHTCTRCGEVIKTEEIPAIDHLTDGGKETKAPNCTEAGVKTHTCTVCGKVIKTEEIPALGHKPGDWVVVKEATKEGPGLKEKYCTVCDAVVDSQTINLYRYLNRKVSTAGIRFSDEGDLTDEWFMFTPVDLSADGEQTIDLVGANKHVIGKVYVTVADGQVTVKHEVYKHVEMKEAFLAFFPDLASVTTLEQSQLTGYAFDEAINIEEQLGGDTKVLLYINGMALYREDGPGLDLFNYAADAYQQHVEELKALMD